LELSAQGETTLAIASQLGYSRSTIHQDKILTYRLLGVHNNRDAIEKAIQLGLI
jgi:DNA-binding NarL/FixJ family response regulator